VRVIEVRAASLDDEQWLTALDLRVWAPDVTPGPPRSAETRFFARAEPKDVFIAMRRSESAGYVALGHPTALAANRHVLQITGLAVDPDCQRQGVGRRLVAAAVAEASRRGAIRLTLHVLGANEAARSLYADSGFHIEGILRGEFRLNGAYVDDVLMARAVPEPGGA